MNESLIHKQAIDFLNQAFNELHKSDVSLEKHWHIDHLCYRTSTQENYLSTKKYFEAFSKLLIESEVNGRLISTFKLHSPIIFGDWDIDLIEVPAPKKGKDVAEGFEHFEVVCDLSFDDIRNCYSHCRFDESGLGKDFNKELKIIFNNFSVKFHHLSLESVINLEKNSSVFSALKTTNVLNLLASFSPLIAGTFPLSVNIDSSDIDILISAKNLTFMKDVLIENFKKYSDFKCKEVLVQNEPSIIVTFSYKNINFEIFGQCTPSVRQKAYRHFLIEERLLKIGGDSFKEKVLSARKQGMKTEPAFAKVLNLKGDSYDLLLDLQKRSNQYLRTLFSDNNKAKFSRNTNL